jgi:hypothetical protein
MTELMSKHDLRKSGDLHRSDSNSFYQGLTSKVAVYEDSGIILNPIKEEEIQPKSRNYGIMRSSSN